MKRQILAALSCCAVAGFALGSAPPQTKAVTPSNKSAPAPAPKSAAPKAVAKKSAPLPAHSTVGHSTSGSSTAGHPATTSSKTAVSGANHSTTGSRTASNTRYASYRRPVRRYSAQQASPTADRYREIQDALAAQGYLKTPSTGVWDKDSIDAMQRFQKDKNLDPTGKLTARSLGLLGLGPKPQETSMLPPNPPASLSANPTNESTPLQ